ncbi:MAG: cyclodeaminase/cyclohydrolase family protein [Elusimicrobiaceae bacterium]|nr:cyclodeaminase/cyclohydrolase family protein [Elusimicrobiaceae bacterium]
MTWNDCAHTFTNALASSAPTPGGGAAAAMAGAMGCALVMMATGTTLKRKATPAEHRSMLEESLQNLNTLHEQLKNFITQDARAYEGYLAAAKLPKENPARTQAVQDALWQAACVPAQTAQVCLQVSALLKKARPYISNIIISDVYCAQHLLSGAVACCVENIRANAAYITDSKRQAQIQAWINTFSQGPQL